MDKTYQKWIETESTYENCNKLILFEHFNIGIPFNNKISKHNLLPAFFGKPFSNQALQYGRFVYPTQKKNYPPKMNYCIEQLK